MAESLQFSYPLPTGLRSTIVASLQANVSNDTTNFLDKDPTPAEYAELSESSKLYYNLSKVSDSVLQETYTKFLTEVLNLSVVPVA
jgi:hypothetical protein